MNTRYRLVKTIAVFALGIILLAGALQLRDAEQRLAAEQARIEREAYAHAGTTEIQ